MVNPDELREFVTNGILVKRGFVAPDLVEVAAALVRDWYRRKMSPDDVAAYTQRTFAPDLGGHPALMALFARSGAADVAGALLGDIQPGAPGPNQIRVRESTLPPPPPDKAMHVDGVACPHLDPADLRTFSLLVGVVLSDVSDERGGALRYLPGGHLSMAEWFRTQWALGMTAQTPPHIDADAGTPLLGRPGDLLLMHHLVPHAVGRNDLAEPRIMAYFRVSHVDHARRRLHALRDPWLDYPGLVNLGVIA